MSTTEINQQQGYTLSAIDADAFMDYTREVFKDAEVNLEFELCEERISPYRVDITKPMEEIEPLVSIGDACVCSAGNISAIVGEAKSKKTFLTTALVASAFAYPYPDREAFENVSANPNLTVLWLDTEQGEAHVRKVIERINRITGITRMGQAEDVRLNVYALRELEPKQRRNLLRDALYTLRPNIVVIDGIADLQYNTNDIEESDSLVGELMALSTEYKCHIISVLHTNPGSDKARGHIGSSLQRKAESVLYVHKEGDVSVVEPQFCRNEPFERFAFTVNSTGLPEICSLPTEITDKDDEVVNILTTYYGGSVERTVLSHKLEEILGLNRTAASMRIHRAIRKGKLTVNDKSITICKPTLSQCHAVTGA